MRFLKKWAFISNHFIAKMLKKMTNVFYVKPPYFLSFSVQITVAAKKPSTSDAKIIFFSRPKLPNGASGLSITPTWDWPWQPSSCYKRTCLVSPLRLSLRCVVVEKACVIKYRPNWHDFFRPEKHGDRDLLLYKGHFKDITKSSESTASCWLLSEVWLTVGYRKNPCQ